MYDEICDLLVQFRNGDKDICETMDQIMSVAKRQIADEINKSLADADFECEQQERKEQLFASLAIGSPDFFSDEMRWFWDNGRLGNV